jgi:hypothetical protein
MLPEDKNLDIDGKLRTRNTLLRTLSLWSKKQVNELDSGMWKQPFICHTCVYFNSDTYSFIHHLRIHALFNDAVTSSDYVISVFQY